MTNLDYEQRMSALNQLIHETLGVSLNTVRAAYGRARNTPLNVCSTASATGRGPVSERRTPSLAEFGSVDVVVGKDIKKRSTERAWMQFDIFDRMPETTRLSFSHRFARADRMADEPSPTPGLDGIPMLLVSQPGIEIDAGETASDWHKLRNEFWNIAQTNRVVMERYKRDVLG